MAPAFALEKVEMKGRERPTFTDAHEKYGNSAVKTSKHQVSMKDGHVQDTWDSRGHM